MFGQTHSTVQDTTIRTTPADAIALGRVGVGMDNAKLVRRERLVGTLFVLPGQVERLARVLPGLLAAPCKTTDLAEPGDPSGKTCQPARADSFADRLLQQRTPLREAPLERI